jgi:phosphate-selective porin OprO/OprP
MKNRQIIGSLIVAALAANVGGPSVFAQETNVDQRLEQLEQEVRILKRQRELDNEATGATAELAKKTPILQVDDKGFGFKSADGNFALRLRGQIKADSRFYLDDKAKAFADTFTLSSARIRVDGTVFRDFEFSIQPEFGSGTTTLLDAYLEWKQWSWLKVRAGKFKQPLGLERLQTDVDNSFTSLGLPSALMPNRDIGLQIGGDVVDGVFSYAVGVFNGVVDGSSSDGDNGDDKDVAARIFVHPFKKTDIELLQGLGVGVAASYGIQRGSTNVTNLASYRTAAGQNTFFSYRSGTGGTFVTGSRTRLSPQGYYYFGRFGLLGEYVISEQDVRRDVRQDTLRNQAWQVAGSFLLTDDKASYKSVSPKKPFSPKDGQWGAWELVARFGEFDVDDDAFTGGAASFANLATAASKATAWTVGLNWYLNKNVRAYLDYEETAFDSGAAGGKDRDTERVVFTRAQVSF